MKAQEQEGIKERYARGAGTLDERGRRAVVASEALALGRGRITAVARATGVSRKVIALGIKELHGTVPSAPPGRIRRRGGGRKKMVERDPSVQTDLDRLVEPVTRGDSDSPLRWTCKSVRTLAAELGAQGHRVSHAWVAGVLRERGYRLQGHRKTRAGTDHPDRGAQFVHVNAAAERYLAAGDPVIAVDARKKELVGDVTNGGREWRPPAEPAEVRVPGFVIPELGRVIPYGVYD